jgi:hypothetical protein
MRRLREEHRIETLRSRKHLSALDSGSKATIKAQKEKGKAIQNVSLKRGKIALKLAQRHSNMCTAHEDINDPMESAPSNEEDLDGAHLLLVSWLNFPLRHCVLQLERASAQKLWGEEVLH